MNHDIIYNTICILGDSYLNIIANKCMGISNNFSAI